MCCANSNTSNVTHTVLILQRYNSAIEQKKKDIITDSDSKPLLPCKIAGYANVQLQMDAQIINAVCVTITER